MQLSDCFEILSTVLEMVDLSRPGDYLSVDLVIFDTPDHVFLLSFFLKKCGFLTRNTNKTMFTPIMVFKYA